jgi:tRNA 2-thiouridine synthesizing protein E
MESILREGKIFKVENGYLVDPRDWCEEWMRHAQIEDGIEEITEEHLKVVLVLRDYYLKNGTTPTTRVLLCVTGFRLKKLYELFPKGPMKSGCKLAGVKPPEFH